MLKYCQSILLLYWYPASIPVLSETFLISFQKIYAFKSHINLKAGESENEHPVLLQKRGQMNREKHVTMEPEAKAPETNELTVKRSEAKEQAVSTVMANKSATNERLGKEATINRRHKDTVFRMLFKDRKNLLSLYNAVNGTRYTKEEDLTIVTLESAIYMTYKNDLAFLIDDYLCLYEHQASYNPNMPLRDLIYIAAEYQKLTDQKALYSSKLQKVQAPRFLTFYNGTDKEVERVTLKLSDAFIQQMDSPELELIVTLFNINEGHNRELLEQCQMLKEYAVYVAKTRKYAKEYPIAEAVEKAVTECIEERVLVDFLRQNREEVVGMSIFEYDEEKELALMRKAEYEEGLQDGLQTGRSEGKKAAKEMVRKLMEQGVAYEIIRESTQILEDEELQKIYEEVNTQLV